MGFLENLFGTSTGNAARIVKALEEQTDNDYHANPTQPRLLRVPSVKPIKISERPGVAFGNG